MTWPLTCHDGVLKPEDNCILRHNGLAAHVTLCSCTHGMAFMQKVLISCMCCAAYHERISPVLREKTDLVDGHSMPKSCRTLTSHSVPTCRQVCMAPAINKQLLLQLNVTVFKFYDTSPLAPQSPWRMHKSYSIAQVAHLSKLCCFETFTVCTLSRGPAST